MEWLKKFLSQRPSDGDLSESALLKTSSRVSSERAKNESLGNAKRIAFAHQEQARKAAQQKEDERVYKDKLRTVIRPDVSRNLRNFYESLRGNLRLAAEADIRKIADIAVDFSQDGVYEVFETTPVLASDLRGGSDSWKKLQLFLNTCNEEVRANPYFGEVEKLCRKNKLQLSLDTVKVVNRSGVDGNDGISYAPTYFIVGIILKIGWGKYRYPNPILNSDLFAKRVDEIEKKGRPFFPDVI